MRIKYNNKVEKEGEGREGRIRRISFGKRGVLRIDLEYGGASLSLGWILMEFVTSSSLGVLLAYRSVPFSFECDNHSLLLPQGLADGYVSQGCLFGEDALAGGTLDLFDVLCATKTAQF